MLAVPVLAASVPKGLSISAGNLLNTSAAFVISMRALRLLCLSCLSLSFSDQSAAEAAAPKLCMCLSMLHLLWINPAMVTEAAWQQPMQPTTLSHRGIRVCQTVAHVKKHFKTTVRHQRACLVCNNQISQCQLCPQLRTDSSSRLVNIMTTVFSKAALCRVWC